MKNQSDVYEKITASIIEAIKAGCGKFEMRWHTFGALPSNASNKRRYRGINVLALWAAASQRGCKTQLWATYRQWRELGAQVRQGEKSTAVVFWKFYGEDSEPDSDSSDEQNTEDSCRRCFARAYNVFNADQVEGFSIPEMPLLPKAQRIQKVEDLFRHTGARIVETGMRAYYDSKADEIHMPPFSVFKKADDFYSTLAHEAIHATGQAQAVIGSSGIGSVLRCMLPRSLSLNWVAHFSLLNCSLRPSLALIMLPTLKIGCEC